VLRSFEAAARYESFTLAAEELSLTQGAISRQVKELEQVIGTELFRRVGRRVVLTMAGRNLASDLAMDLKNIQRSMTRAISAGAMGTALRVACLPTFASRWLIPRLPTFFTQNPDIEISLSTRQDPFDLGEEHFDMAIHFGQKNWPDANLRPLCSEQLIAVSSPAFRDSHNIHNVNDILQAPILHISARPTAWLDYFNAVGLAAPGVLTGKYFDQFNMIIAASLASLGSALVPTYLIETELENGSLVKLGDAVVNTENNYYLVTPLGQQNNNVDRLQKWMLDSVTPS
jgi:LysR family glycine cleavage system transcriptional activator